MLARPSWLLASDMDGTVIPLDRSPGRAEEIQALSTAVAAVPALALGYVTGRSLELAVRGMEDFRLPPAVFLAVDVGTRIFHFTRSGYVPDPEYDRRMMQAVGGIELREVSRMLEGVPGLTLQPDWGQGRFKRSYFVDASLPDDELQERVREILEQEGAQVSLVASHDPVRDVGLLDVLPHGVAKDVAVRYLHERARTAPERVVYAGDSGNDWAAFLAGYSGILVANAPESLKARLRTVQTQQGEERRIFFAEAPFAGGVLQGLRHYGVV